MEQGTRDKRGKHKRKEWLMGNGLMACLIVLLLRIPLSHIIGDRGLGFLAAGFELFATAGIVLSYGLSKAVAIMVKYRLKREMFKSIGQVYKAAMLVSIIVGAGVSVAVFFGAEVIAGMVLSEPKSYLAIAAAAPAIGFTAVLGVQRGYFEGINRMTPVFHSRILEKIILIVACVVGAVILYPYGLKVAALLKSEEYAAVYGAMGAAMGVTVASILAVVHLSLLHMLYGSAIKKQFRQESMRTRESMGSILLLLLSTACPYLFYQLINGIHYLADQAIFNYFMERGSRGISLSIDWGRYYGKYSVIIEGTAILCSLIGLKGISRIVQSIEREDTAELRRRLSRNIHYLAVCSIPAAIWTAILVSPIVRVIFGQADGEAVQLIQLGSVGIIFFSFSSFFMEILRKIRKMGIVILGMLAAFVIHLFLLILLLKNTNLGIQAVVISMVVFWLVNCIFGWIVVIRKLRYRQDWIRTFGITILAAGISGAVGLLILALLSQVAGAWIILLLCLVLCPVLYLILLLVLRGIRKDELEEMPGGRLVIFFAQRLRLI